MFIECYMCVHIYQKFEVHTYTQIVEFILYKFVVILKCKFYKWKILDIIRLIDIYKIYLKIQISRFANCNLKKKFV